MKRLLMTLFILIGFNFIHAQAKADVSLPESTVKPVLQDYVHQGQLMQIRVQDTGWVHLIQLMDSSKPDMKAHGTISKTFSVQLSIVDTQGNEIDLSDNNKDVLSDAAKVICGDIFEKVTQKQEVALNKQVVESNGVGYEIVKKESKITIHDLQFIKSQVRTACQLDFHVEAI